MYSSSKAALNNLYQGKEYLNKKNIKMRLINFGKNKYTHDKKFVRQNTANVISPNVAALKICKIFDKGSIEKRVFITGIAGQDGSYLAELLAKKGYKVYGIIRRNSIEGIKKAD